MKSRERSKKPGKADVRKFAEALLALETVNDCEKFLEDLCTPAELEAMVDRWRVVEMLEKDMTYRDIAEKTGISVTTVGRVARCIEFGQGYRLVYERMAKKRKRK